MLPLLLCQAYISLEKKVSQSLQHESMLPLSEIARDITILKICDLEERR